MILYVIILCLLIYCDIFDSILSSIFSILFPCIAILLHMITLKAILCIVLKKRTEEIYIQDRTIRYEK